jgi:hypothetical protein
MTASFIPNSSISHGTSEAVQPSYWQRSKINHVTKVCYVHSSVISWPALLLFTCPCVRGLSSEGRRVIMWPWMARFLWRASLGVAVFLRWAGRHAECGTLCDTSSLLHYRLPVLWQTPREKCYVFPLSQCVLLGKLLLCNAHICFNKTCLKENITPKYARLNKILLFLILIII